MKTRTFAAAVIMGLSFASPAWAEDVEGVVKVVGSSLSRKVMINASDDAKHRLCDNEVAKRVSRLTGMTVRVSGDWKMRKEEKFCITGTDFAVKKVSSGRDALVGVLSQTSDGYEVKSEDGKAHVFTQVPDGLKKLVGKKVIIDMKPMNSPTSQGATYSVVTYSPFP